MSALTPRDYEDFLRLRIPRDIVDGAQISRIGRLEAERYGIRIHGDSGLLFPHFLPPINGHVGTHAGGYTVRDLDPQFDTAGEAERKYVCSPGRQYPYTVPVDPLRYEDLSVPVVLVEAAKSALSLLRWSEDHRRRLIPVGIAGCYGWRGVTGIAVDENGERVQTKGLNPTLAAICRGHRVYIFLDQNATTNPHVQHGRAWLADTLLDEEITTDVRILELPPSITAPFWNGPDDFIAVRDDEAIFKIFEDGRRWQANTFKTAFHKVSELASGEPEAIIEGYFEEGLSLLGAKSGVGKTWIALSEGQALRTGKSLFGTFPIPQQRSVLYLIPEMTERRLRSRYEKLGLDINDPNFLVRTMNDGAPLPLNDPRLRACVERLRPVVYLDTAIRFGGGMEENSAGDVSHGLINATYQLIQLGAPAVRGLHHRAKDASDDELTLENVLRGSGDFGAGAVCVWGASHETAYRAGKFEQEDLLGRRKSNNAVRKRIELEYLQESKRLGRIRLELVKPGDRDPLLWDFRIQLRPFINKKGQVEMLTHVLPKPDIDELLKQEPQLTGEELGKRLAVHRTTAVRQAQSRGWFQDGGTWNRRPL